jgi:hypothetical protein
VGVGGNGCSGGGGFLRLRAGRGRLLLPSIRRFFQLPGSWLDRLQGYIYARWTNPYVDFLLNRTPRHEKGGLWFADHYHGKVLPHDHAEAIVSLDRSLAPRDLEQTAPYPAARRQCSRGRPPWLPMSAPALTPALPTVSPPRSAWRSASRSSIS